MSGNYLHGGDMRDFLSFKDVQCALFYIILYYDLGRLEGALYSQKCYVTFFYFLALVFAKFNCCTLVLGLDFDLNVNFFCQIRC